MDAAEAFAKTSPLLLFLFLSPLAGSTQRNGGTRAAMGGDTRRGCYRIRRGATVTAATVTDAEIGRAHV